jgi:uncharacterized damage-inducible protein DinB
MINKPANGEYHEFYQTYVSKLKKDDILEVLQDQAKEIPELLKTISEGKSKYQYEEGKWTIAQLVQHINDTERVFAYRAFAIARGDKASFPGMDQDDYANAAFTENRTLGSLTKEFEAVRASTLSFFESMDASVVANVGTASDFPITVRGIAGIIAGHAAHHIDILKERYLSD